MAHFRRRIVSGAWREYMHRAVFSVLQDCAERLETLVTEHGRIDRGSGIGVTSAQGPLFQSRDEALALRTVQALLGHSSSEITREVYLHSIPADAQAAVQKVEDLLIRPKLTQDVVDWKTASSLIPMTGLEKVGRGERI